MKLLKILLIFLILFSACRTTKKITESSNTSAKAIDASQTVSTQEQTKVDKDKVVDASLDIQNDKKTYLKTTTTITDYFPPEPGSGKGKGAIKSETTTTTERQDSDRGKQTETKKEADKSKTEMSQAKQEASQTKSNEDSSAKTFVKEVKKANPNVKWIIILVLVGAAIGFWIWLKKSPSGVLVKSFLKRIFGG